MKFLCDLYRQPTRVSELQYKPSMNFLTMKEVEVEVEEGKKNKGMFIGFFFHLFHRVKRIFKIRSLNTNDVTIGH